MQNSEPSELPAVLTPKVAGPLGLGNDGADSRVVVDDGIYGWVIILNHTVDPKPAELFFDLYYP